MKVPESARGRAFTDVHVRFDGVYKSYDRHTQVIRDLSLDIYRGEFLTMLGPSGSGKSTCLMMLAGFEHTTAGTIEINGQPVQDIPPYRRGIGMVFQNYALFPHMTVGRNLAFPLEVRNTPREQREQRVSDVLELVQLAGFRDRKPGQLSGGQQQRVAIARALVFEPDLVLMDEPLGALDRRLREEMQYEIRRIQRQIGVTMVYVTHDQTEAMVLSDRIAVFRDGRIEQIADPVSMYEEPNRVFVSSFIGENNKLFGNVLRITDRQVCEVDVNGDTVQAFKVGDIGEGDEVAISIRPERVIIDPQHHMVANVFDAQVRDIVFLGDNLRLNLSVCGVDDFVVKIPNMAGHGAVLEGDSIRIGWATLDCRALAVEPSCP